MFLFITPLKNIHHLLCYGQEGKKPFGLDVDVLKSPCANVVDVVVSSVTAEELVLMSWLACRQRSAMVNTTKPRRQQLILMMVRTPLGLPKMNYGYSHTSTTATGTCLCSRRVRVLMMMLILMKILEMESVLGILFWENGIF